MAERNPVLRRHRLAHIPELLIEPVLLQARFHSGCRTATCGAACCRWGVWADVEERDRILAHAGPIQQAMDETQDKNPAHWFESSEQPDPDFPSGRAVGTEVVNDRCVFLDAAGLCVLQRASAAPADGLQLKPFFCRLYPLTLCNGVLTLDDETAEHQTRCCGVTAGGPSTIFDVCHEELALVVDAQGLAELRGLADRRE